MVIFSKIDSLKLEPNGHSLATIIWAKYDNKGHQISQFLIFIINW